MNVELIQIFLKIIYEWILNKITFINLSFNDDQLLLWLPPLCISLDSDFSNNKLNYEFVKI